ncbi:MAG: nucleoside deaminase [Ruminococcaceae bacterium]|nr:nucleoside deaminase [Oscillospiraceae bacterium]
MNTPSNDELYMALALREAEKAARIGETPIGAVIVCDGKVISRAHNARETDKNALYHAEIRAIYRACRALGGWRLHKCELYVTLEPCPMCAGAIMSARIKRVVYAAPDPKAGAYGGLFDLNAFAVNHKPIVESGVMEAESRDLLKRFFAELREKKKREKQEKQEKE